jgi:TniQ
MAGGAVTTPLLVRHPAPFPTESLLGYILRLSEENGYTTPWSLLLLGRIGQHETRSTGMKVVKLAQISNRFQTELQSISYRWPGDRLRSCRLLGNLLTRWELVITRPKLCPECVAEAGFIEVHFDLALMTGCPVHRRSLLSRCPGCMNPLRWFRPGLLECDCGASLRNVSLPAISAAEADLLDIVRRKTLGIAAGRDYVSRLPSSHLEVMRLQPLLSVVAMLGRRRMMVDQDSDRRNPQRIVSAAASVLADWPNNFFRLLRGITEGEPKGSSTGVARGSLSGIYRSLLSLRRIKPTEQADFLRIAFLGFIRNDWRPDFIDQKLMKRLRIDESERFVSKAAFARRYGIDPRTATRFVEDQRVPSKAFRWGLGERKLIDSAAARLSPTLPGKIYRLRQAAAMIGISVGLLRRMKATGDFEVNHLLGTKPGFHELDIEAFIQKLKRLAPPVNPADLSSPKYIRFAIVARGWYGSVAAKANIVRAVLSGELPVVGNAEGTVAGLLVSYEGFQRLAHDERARANGATRTIAEAARLLECNTRSIRRLVELEWLRARPTPKAFRVTEESITEFKKRYVSLLSIARTTNSASWALQDICERYNLPMLVARQLRRKGGQAFIREEQRQELLCLRSGRSLKSGIS